MLKTDSRNTNCNITEQREEHIKKLPSWAPCPYGIGVGLLLGKSTYAVFSKMRFILVFSFVLYRYTVIYRGSVHPLQDVALRITSPVVSLSGISAPSDSFHLHDVVSPSLHLSTSWSFAISWLPVCDSFRPSVVIESCYMACPFPFLLCCEFDYVFNIFNSFVLG